MEFSDLVNQNIFKTNSTTATILRTSTDQAPRDCQLFGMQQTDQKLCESMASVTVVTLDSYSHYVMQDSQG